MTSQTLSRTPLYDVIAPTARMTEFSGWEMPVQFSSLKQEHQAVRTHAGLFDISHMGKFLLEGDALLSHICRLVPTDLHALQPGQAQYTVLLSPEGGILDDLIIYYQGETAASSRQRAIAIVNASTRNKDANWIRQQLADSGVELTDLGSDRVLLALQGPQSLNLLQALAEDELSQLKAFGHCQTRLLGQNAFVARTGYTGEDGVEIMLEPEAGKQLWHALLDAGVTPCGLGARDTLRLEAAMALYGQDIEETTTPYEAGLGWLVHLEGRGEFIGKAALVAQKAKGIQRKLVGIEMGGRHIARHGYAVLHNGETVGEVTSGTLSPTLGKPIALAYVPSALAKVAQQLEIAIRGQTYPATVVKKPFYRSAVGAPK